MKENLTPDPNSERNAKARQSTWRDLLILTEHPEYITAEPNTLNDPDFPDWTKDIAQQILNGTMTWEDARNELLRRFPT